MGFTSTPTAALHRRAGYADTSGNRIDVLLSDGPAEQGVAPEAVAEAYHAWEQGSQVAPLSAAAVSNQTIQESQRLLLLVRAYQVWEASSIWTYCGSFLGSMQQSIPSSGGD